MFRKSIFKTELSYNLQLKSSQVVRAYIDRIKDVNPILNAVSEDRFKDAVKQAEDVDRLLESKSKSVDMIERDTPLLGVPMTVKESCQVKGETFEPKYQSSSVKTKCESCFLVFLRFTKKCSPRTLCFV